jgi:ATP-dependent Clp protease ATP-binding subunit ClpC
MTSNLGARAIEKQTSLGFRRHDEQMSYERMNDLITTELKRMFNPEFLNRLDDVIVFHSLTEDHIGKIVEIMIDEVNAQLNERGMVLELSAEAKEWILQRGFDPAYGARPLRRIIQRHVEDALAEEVLKGNFEDNSMILVTVEDDELAFVEMLPALSSVDDDIEINVIRDT